MNVSADVLSALNKVTLRSTHKKHMTGCVIVVRNQIVSDGCSHASSFRIRELHSIHAEIHALARGRHLMLNGGTAYIKTIARKSGNTCLSAPCLTCAIALKSAGITNCIYTSPCYPVPCWNSLNLDDDLSHLKVYPKRDEI